MKNSKFVLKKQTISNITFSFILATIFSLIPWEYFRYAEYYDRVNYINYIDIYVNKIQWFDFSGFLTKILYEWGWHYFLNYLTSQLAFNSSIILFLISLFFLTISFILVSSNKSLFLCFFLLNPMYVDFFYSQIRLSFAIAFIYLSILVFNKNKYLSLVLLLPSFFIHTSSFLFTLIFYTAIFLEKTTLIGSRLKALIAMFIGLMVAFATGPYMSVLLGAVEDRRAEYNDMSSPTLYMIYWIGLFLFFAIKYFSNKLQSLNYYYVYISISILSMVFLNVFLIGYSSRFLVASFPFLVLTIGALKGRSESIIGIIYVFYTMVLWYFWLT
ncbi:EpsG family protein [Psychrobacter immobilis]|uniref:EpsG family protein n=1 Tax=Psychrobacter immobilis TaxID=498 RepID=UPI00191871C0|nr:EpsG family protein [Psychrobacter immobilis]